MRLQVLLPYEVLVDRDDVTKVATEAPHGAFAILPRHVDVVAPLVPGLLLFETSGGESVIGVSEGFLVKQGDHVRVSTRDAVRSDDLGRIRELVRERFERLDERETEARTALMRLEASFYRRFIEQEASDGGP